MHLRASGSAPTLVLPEFSPKIKQQHRLLSSPLYEIDDTLMMNDDAYYRVKYLECKDEQQTNDLVRRTLAQRLCTYGSVHIVEVQPSPSSSNTVKVVFEHAEQSLQSYILEQQQQQHLPESLIWDIVGQMILSLRQIHAAMAYHGGIDMSNVFVGRWLRLHIGPPDLTTSTSTSAASDISAVGCCMYEMVTRRNAAADKETGLFPQLVPVSYSVALSKLLERLVVSSPPASVDELLAADATLCKVVQRLEEEQALVDEIVLLEAHTRRHYHDIRPTSFAQRLKGWKIMISNGQLMRSLVAMFPTTIPRDHHNNNNNNDDDDDDDDDKKKKKNNDGEVLLTIAELLSWLHVRCFRRDVRELAHMAAMLVVLSLIGFFVGLLIDLTLELFLLFVIVLAMPLLIIMTTTPPTSSKTDMLLSNKTLALRKQLPRHYYARGTAPDDNFRLIVNRVYETVGGRFRHFIDSITEHGRVLLDRMMAFSGYSMPVNGKINDLDVVKPGRMLKDVSDSVRLLYHTLFEQQQHQQQHQQQQAIAAVAAVISPREEKDDDNDDWDEQPPMNHTLIIIAWLPLFLMIGGAIFGHVIAAAQQLMIVVTMIVFVLLVTVATRTPTTSSSPTPAPPPTSLSTKTIHRSKTVADTTASASTNVLSPATRMLTRHYETVRALDRSGERVFLVIERISGEAYALKHLDELAADAWKEIIMHQSCNSPYVVGFKEHIKHEESNRMSIVLEYCEGGSLFMRLRRAFNAKEKIPERQALRWLAQLVLGLEYLHSKSMVHRDLKPGNILLDRWDRAKIADFGRGLAAGDNSHVTADGTVGFMAPEVVNSHHHNATPAPTPYDTRKADVYSLGCVMYEVLTLRSAHFDTVNGYFPQPCPAVYGAQVAKLLTQMLEPKPEKRISIDEIIRRVKWLQPVFDEVKQESSLLAQVQQFEQANHLTFVHRHPRYARKRRHDGNDDEDDGGDDGEDFGAHTAQSSAFATFLRDCLPASSSSSSSLWISRLVEIIQQSSKWWQNCVAGVNILRSDISSIVHRPSSIDAWQLFHVMAWCPLLLALAAFITHHMVSASKQMLLLIIMIIIVPVFTNISHKAAAAAAGGRGMMTMESDAMIMIGAYTMTVAILRVEDRVLLLQIVSGWCAVVFSCAAYHCVRALRHHEEVGRTVLHVTSGIALGVALATSSQQTAPVIDTIIVHIVIMLVSHTTTSLLYRSFEESFKRQRAGVQHLFVPLVTMFAAVCWILSIRMTHVSLNRFIFMLPLLCFAGTVVLIDQTVLENGDNDDKDDEEEDELPQRRWWWWWWWWSSSSFNSRVRQQILASIPWCVMTASGFLVLISVTSTLYQSYA